MEFFRYGLYRNIYENAGETTLAQGLFEGVRKTCRSARPRGLPKALACLFQGRLAGEMRPMPVVQVHNKKEAQ